MNTWECSICLDPVKTYHRFLKPHRALDTGHLKWSSFQGTTRLLMHRRIKFFHPLCPVRIHSLHVQCSGKSQSSLQVELLIPTVSTLVIISEQPNEFWISLRDPALITHRSTRSLRTKCGERGRGK